MEQKKKELMDMDNRLVIVGGEDGGRRQYKGDK